MPNEPIFQTIDDYIDGLFVSDDAVLNRAIARAHAADLPAHHVSPGQGKLLYLMAKMIGAARVLEIGTLAGYSTIWLARALPDGGRVTSLELNPAHIKVAAETIEDAGLSDKVSLIEGKALDILAGMDETFDLVFLDANKDHYPAYLQHAVRMTRPGGLILADNVMREGAVMAPKGMDSSAIGAAAFNQALAAHPKLEAIILQQVGKKGHDGLAIARVRD